MAKQTLSIHSNTYLPVVACQTVKLCLTDEWVERTVSGTAIVEATMADSIRELGTGAGGHYNPRNTPQVQYSVQVDDAQFLVDLATDAPWVLDCDSVVEIIPYACAVDKLTPVPPLELFGV